MSEYSVARVVVNSPLLTLDKEFDYSIPEEYRSQVRIGSMVQVAIGKSTKQYDAYVVGLATSSEFKLRDIIGVNGSMPFLPASSYSLLRALADRSVCAIGDLIRLAVADRMVRIEAKFADAKWAAPHTRKAAIRTTAITNAWVSATIERAKQTLSDGESVIVVTPDYRDQNALVAKLTEQKIPFLDFATTQTKSARYESFLTAQTDGTHLVIGNRTAIYAPLQNLGLIILVDEADDSLVEQTAPYLSVREVALQRSTLENCDVHFVAATRSTDIQRLVEIRYLSDVSKPEPSPKVSFDSENSRNSPLAYAAIREAAAVGSVLVQVPGKGQARSCYCQQCQTRALCHECGGPLWIDATGVPRCRWCNRQNLDFVCKECKSANLRQGVGGATRTVAEFGKAFPGVAVVESSADKPKLHLPAGRRIVIATPGAEPEVDGGYAAVVILDAGASLHIDSLRATERAVRRWVNAIIKVAPTGRAVIAGVPAKLGQTLALWQLVEIAKNELVERRELQFPPHLRLASVQGETELVRSVVQVAQNAIPGLIVLGPIQLRSDGKNESRFVIKFNYSDGQKLADELRAAIIAKSTGSSVSPTGKAQRAIRVRMDDAEVV